MRNLNAAARREIARLDDIANRPMPESIEAALIAARWDCVEGCFLASGLIALNGVQYTDAFGCLNVRGVNARDALIGGAA